MKKNDPVTHIMSKKPVTLDSSDPVSKARQLFETTGVHHLPVVKGEALEGILSWTDFLRISFGEFGNQDSRGLDAVLDHTYTIRDVMKADPVTMPSTGTVRDAAHTGIGLAHFSHLRAGLPRGHDGFRQCLKDNAAFHKFILGGLFGIGFLRIRVR